MDCCKDAGASRWCWFGATRGFGDCLGEFCALAFRVAWRVEMRDVRLFCPSAPGNEVSPGI